MKIGNTTVSTVERNNVSSEGQFSIAFNAKMAKILSDGLYSDKVKSIIRELSCNAVDSHVESGQRDRPIEVHLPTTFEPWFHVKDFGVGLDHAEVMKIYTVYGNSTKTNSNDPIGQLGLGSKSPFSYVDAFTIVAIKNGVERHYSAFKNETGMPSIALLNEIKTKDHNGVLVKMPVKQIDFSEFVNKAADVFKWFDVKPNFTGNTTINVPNYKIEYEGTGWKILTHNYNKMRPIALMGPVAYPIDTQFSIRGLTPAHRAILNTSLVLTFNIGDLEIAASREALGYDDRTQSAIIDKLNLVLKELGESLEKRIATAKTEWDARIEYGKIFSQSSIYRYEISQAFGHIGLKWKNTLIKSSSVMFDLSKFWNDPTGKTTVSIPIWRSHGSYKNVRQEPAGRTQINIECHDKFILIFNDLEKGQLNRVNYFVQTDGKYAIDVMLISTLDNTLIDQTTIDKIVDSLGNPEYIMSSALPKRPVASRGKRTNGVIYNGTGNGQKAWTTTSIDLDAGGYYIILDRWEIKFEQHSTIDLQSAYDGAKTLGIIDANDIILAPRGDMKEKIKNDDNWIEFFSHIRNKVNSKLTPAVIQNVADSIHYTTYINSIKEEGLWKSPWLFIDNNGVFSKFIEAITFLDKNNVNCQKDVILINLAKSFGNKINDVTPTYNLPVLYKKMLAKYPMIELMFLNSYYVNDKVYNGNKLRAINEYINLIDSAALAANATSNINI